MRNLTFAVRRSIISAGLLATFPMIALAAGGPAANPPAAPAAKPDRQVKVWTNEDVQALGPASEPASSPARGQTSGPVSESLTATSRQTAAIPPAQNPLWYASQVDALSSELASVTAEKDSLQHFMPTGSGLQPGLNIDAPCVIINTYDLIAQLDARQAELQGQLDALADAARENEISPSTLIPGEVNIEAAKPPREQRADLLDQYVNLTEQLGQAADTVASMQSDTAARNMTLLQPDARWGGNYTTSFLQDLYDRQSTLENQINTVEDGLRQQGLTPQ